MDKILLVQFIAHLIADFFAQPECFIRGKQKSFLKSGHIYIHASIVFIASCLMTFSCDFLFYAVAIAMTHLIIDIVKSGIENKMIKKGNGDANGLYINPKLFFIDQFLHLIIIYIVVRLYWQFNQIVPEYINHFSVRDILIGIGILICLKPTNVMVRTCLSSLNLNIEDTTNARNLAKAGRWIGSIERTLAFVLVLLSQYTAIGFIIAAKSVLRFSENDTHKTEYVLVGTLLSFGVAVLFAVCIKEGILESLIQYLCYS